MRLLNLTLALLAVLGHAAELRVPAATAYLDPKPDGARVSREGISGWRDAGLTISWFGEIKTTGSLDAAVALRLPHGAKTKFTLTIGTQSREATADSAHEDSTLNFGSYTIAQPGYVRFTLSSPAPVGEILALVLSGPAIEGAHFNLDARRNAASVHLRFPVPAGTEVAAFYNEVTALEDPTATYYMACGFSRGYFGMQVNSPTERRIIFSVWDSGAGSDANDRSTVAAEDHVTLLAKGDGVHASVFGNEGTGGHSHLKYPWKTGEAQRFIVTAKPEGTHTDYSGHWFHPEEKKWMLIASFRAPKDGKGLRGLYSFSENFSGANGHLPRKALFGPQWIRTAAGQWLELTSASFSHDPTGKANRLDRCMGVESGRFFLAHGGFLPGFTKSGETFKRPATSQPPDFP
jgi:hypothetical protein